MAKHSAPLQAQKKRSAPKPKAKPARTAPPLADSAERFEVEMLAPDQVIPYARNPRLNADAVSGVAGSLKEFGWRQPIVVDEQMVVLVGHTRLLAAQQLGLKKVPVHVARGLTPQQARAYRLADNPMLGLELSELSLDGFDVSLTGFTTDEVATLTNPEGGLLEGADPDDVPIVPTDPITKPGDLILLGRHRLVCGDSTLADVVDKALGGARPALMVTDPPYGVDYDPAWRDEAAKYSPAMGNRKDTATGVVTNDHTADWTEAWALFTGDVVYCWHAGRHASRVQATLEEAGFEIRSQIIWAKAHLCISRGHYHWQHEPCWYAFRKGATAGWIGDRKQTTLWEIEHRKSETGHSTQKPVEAMRRPIQNHSGDVYDPFLGSGTTLIAAEMMGRTCYGVELSPAYCDVIVARWEKATGQTAERPR
jgi:DNA modification methylase